MLAINDLYLSFNGLISENNQYLQSAVDGQINVIIGILGGFNLISFIIYFYFRKIKSLIKIIPIADIINIAFPTIVV
ncbi:unnamed protein product [Blepharisma stoltei]|uniref:Uncharacterized protein n=1 Tax=Blepharisma stoltei TaxID=1481888 RepID=A0AAU9JG33_9CILI|nr:unnamed protein product [Blepharisma stoltei]